MKDPDQEQPRIYQYNPTQDIEGKKVWTKW